MIELQNSRLKEILKEINMDSQTLILYASKLDRVINFLRNSTGFKMAGIKKSGSQAKQTGTRKSDLDVIFCTARNQDSNTVKHALFEKARSAFKGVANISVGKKAVHLDYNKPRCNLDLVYLSNQEFRQESKKINAIRSIRPMYKNAIKLAKYALDAARVRNIESYEVELACVNMNCETLSECTASIIKYFSNRIQINGLTLDKVLINLT